MCCKTLGMLIAALKEADTEKLHCVPGDEVVALIEWADGYAWDVHHPLSFATPDRVLETGVRILFGQPQSEVPRDRGRQMRPLDARRAQWGRKASRVRRTIMGQDGACCQNCGSSDRLSIDHILPLSRGGSDDPENLQVLCKSCNSSKGARTMEEWRGGGS